MMEEQGRKSEPLVTKVNALAAQMDQHEIRVAKRLHEGKEGCGVGVNITRSL